MLFLILTSLCILSCKSPIGSSVPWYAAFKVPKISDKIPTHATGLGYFYRDDNTQLTEGPEDLNSSYNNPLYETLKQMYTGSSDIGYLLFSDQPPGDKDASSSRAHLKGVMVFDSDNGIYLVHSTPRFPNDPATGEFSYPDSGVTYGQSFLCMTLEHEELDKIAKSYLIEFPYIYASNEPDFTESKLPYVKDLLDSKWNKNEDTFIAEIKTASKTFKLFGKSNSWNYDIYHDLIALNLQKDTFSSTWSNGVGTMTSDCSGDYYAINVLYVNFGSAEWQRSKDHSKWAVSGSHVCIGGINRQESQKKRGGDAFCVDYNPFAQEILSVISSYEECSNESS
ncbi:Plancitoxin-1 [Tritrichomonas foetus]|uniref:Plancitoxin-1 n=1 Tax=Tritrichomonas foetus TaxID=1144522 RepID=A0A1J4J0G7_9EUKA|nr:Plancitoxin-1 [Tritrichomonas foetus]|eukprot:OHS92906.1 Plancitoxin-1 [Tritrichomonas foetus]